METKKRNSPNSDSLSHPDRTQWMEYLYGEMPRNDKPVLEQHLKSCPDCARKVDSWRSTMTTLDTFAAPKLQPRGEGRTIRWVWPAAAAAIVILSFLLGRAASANREDVAKLKKEVQELSQKFASERQTNLAIIADQNRSQMERLLADFSQVQMQQRQQDRIAVNQALAALDGKVGRVESELETMAINTASNFEQTHNNLRRVASISLANNETYKNPHN